MVRPCIYCELPKAKSQEHVLASWIIEVLSQDTRGLPLPLRMELSDQSGGKRVTLGKTKRSKTLEFTTRVCRDCNSGWMNDMEIAVRPYLEPMIRGAKCHIDAAWQHALAAWAAKFAVTARFAHIHPDHIERQWTQHVALSDRLTRTGPPACLEAPQQAFRCPVCHGFPTCLRARLPVLVGGLDALRLNATAPR
jgi:hypothetical protein